MMYDKCIVCEEEGLVFIWTKRYKGICTECQRKVPNYIPNEQVTLFLKLQQKRVENDRN